jgi:hypothetical protein
VLVAAGTSAGGYAVLTPFLTRSRSAVVHFLHSPKEMRVKRLILTVLCCGSASVTHAQVFSIYGTFSPLHVSNVETGSVATSTGYIEQYTSFWTPAFGGGVTLNFLNLHVVKLGLDARGSTKSGTTGADTAELSLRLGFQPPVLRLKPYVQGGVGYLATRTANVGTTSIQSSTPVGGTFSNQYATVGFHAGVDKPLIPLLDFRIVDLGFAHAFNTGISSSANNANAFSISTGLVAHF